MMANTQAMNIERNKGMLEPPWLVPVPIKTHHLPWWKKLFVPFSNRFFCLGDDFRYYNSQGVLCMIPGAFKKDENGAFLKDENGVKILKDAYFKSDGTSWPRFIRFLLSKVGVGIVGGLAHDSYYAWQVQIKADGTIIEAGMSRARADEEMRLISLDVNGIKWMAWGSYWILRACGGFAWNAHRNNDEAWTIRQILRA